MIYKKKRKGIFKLNCFNKSNDKILSIQKQFLSLFLYYKDTTYILIYKICHRKFLQAAASLASPCTKSVQPEIRLNTLFITFSFYVHSTLIQIDRRLIIFSEKCLFTFLISKECPLRHICPLMFSSVIYLYIADSLRMHSYAV